MLEPWVVWSVLHPSSSSRFICTQMWAHHSTSCHLAHPCPPATTLPQFSLPWLLISTPPTSMDKCFFFNSLVVGLPYCSIFCLFWLVFVFKFIVVLLLVVRGGTVRLSMPLSWLEVLCVCIFYASTKKHTYCPSVNF